MYSIKTKLVILIMLLVIGLFSVAAFLLIQEKQKDMTEDIFFQARSFAELTAPNIIDDYNLYLAQEGFIYFNREMAGNFQRTQDIDLVQIYNYNGQMLYDSQIESVKQYDGPIRMISDETIMSQIQAQNSSVLTQYGRIVFLKKQEDGEIKFVDKNEVATEPLEQLERLEYIVFPVRDEYAVIYHINYESLEAAVKADIIRILMLAALGVIVGLFMALFVAGKITKPIRVLTKGSKIIAKGDFQHRVNIHTHDELEVLGGAFNKMAADLEKSTKALVYKERVAKELELAQKIQQELIPKKIPEMPGLDISAGIVSAEEIGGDVYDFMKRDENNTLFYVGDVTGHGVPAGILGSIANAIFFSKIKHPDIRQMMVEVNNVIKAKSPPNMFITLCLLNWDASQRKLTYVNAGHEQILHFSAKTNSVELLKAGGIALGMFPDISKMIEERDIPIHEGDCFVLYSDGIPEAWRTEKEQYGMDKFKAALQQYGSQERAVNIRNSILKDVKAFIGDYKQMDDITIMVIKVPKGGEIASSETADAILKAEPTASAPTPTAAPAPTVTPATAPAPAAAPAVTSATPPKVAPAPTPAAPSAPVAKPETPPAAPTPPSEASKA